MRKTILGTLVAVVATLVLVVGLYSAQRTTYLSLPFTNDADMNDALRRIDEQVGQAMALRGTQNVIFCGQQPNTGTIFVGPALAGGFLGAYGTTEEIGGTACNALDNATEATADNPLSTNSALYILGMYCIASSSGSNGVDVTLRSAEADLSPSLTCNIPTTEVDCFDGPNRGATPVLIGAGATMAVELVNTEDLSTGDIWCRVTYAFAD